LVFSFFFFSFFLSFFNFFSVVLFFSQLFCFGFLKQVFKV